MRMLTTTTPGAPVLRSQLRITLSGIARLARVQRPVVSVWRSRSVASESPFPSPLSDERGQEHFDALEVAEWLVATGRGKNPDPIADAPVFARLDSATPGDAQVLHVSTSLIALRGAAGRHLGQLSRAELLDLAEEVDPDDSFLFSELDRQHDLEPFARFVDVLVDGAYDTGTAFESVMVERFREGHRELSRTALEPAASALMHSAALELARTNPAADPDSPAFADTTGSAGDLMVGIAAEAPEHLDVVMLTAEENADAADADTGSARLLRRRLLAHGIARASLGVRGDEFGADAPVVHVIRLPSRMTDTPERMLEAVNSVALQLDDRQRALILAPATVLCDGDLPEPAATIRSDVIRTGRVRAIVRLPRGLVTANPRQSLALWVLGPSYRQVALSERWTMLADLSDTELSADVQRDLVSDVVAAMGHKDEVRAHAFRFSRFALTSGLLARTGSLLGEAGALNVAVQASRPAAEAVAARLDSVIARLGNDAPMAADGVRASSLAPLPSATIASLLAEGHLRCVPGTRIESAELSTSAGFAVIGEAELTGAPVGDRTIDRLAFAARHPNARLTEPGDVIFIAGTKPRALVDPEGSAVVAYPARILRIDRGDSGGVVSEVLATDIRSATSPEWRRWPVRRVVPLQREPLRAALASIRSAREDAEQRLANLIELEHLVTDAVTRGAVSLTKGTH